MLKEAKIAIQALTLLVAINLLFGTVQLVAENPRLATRKWWTVQFIRFSNCTGDIFSPLECWERQAAHDMGNS